MNDKIINNQNLPRTLMKYTEQQKQEVLQLLARNVPIQEINLTTKVPVPTIYRWRKEPRDNNSQESIIIENDNYRELLIKYEQLEKKLEECCKYISMLKRADEKSKRKASDWEEPVKGWKPPQR